MIYLGIFIFVLNTFLGFFTIYKKKTFEAIVFGIFASSFGLWAISIYLTILSSSLFWSRTAFLGAILGIGSLLLFTFIFPGNRKVEVKTIVAITVLPFLLSIFTYSDFMIKTVTVSNGAISGTFGSLMSIYQFFAPLYIFGALYIIFTKFLKSKKEDKKKIQYVLIGVSLFVGPAVITNAVLPLWLNINSLNNIGPVFSMCMVGFISYAIIRHQFLDIKVIIQKGLIYSTLITLITITYLILVFTFEYVFQKSDSSSILVSALITTLIGIFGVPPLKLYFQRVTDSVFFKDTYDYATVLRQLTDILNKNIILDTLVEKSALLIKNSLRAETVLFSFNPGEKVTGENMLSLPITSNDHYIGTLYVGEKRSGDAYTTEDMSLLETFTKQAGIALEKASLYKQVDDYAKTLEDKVEERTKEISIIQKEQETMMLEISHGLQTPLTIMKGELFLLRKQGHETKRVDTIDASIDRISSFIYRFLSLSRLETANTVPMTTIQLTLLLHQVTQFFEQEATEKGISLSASLADSVQVEGIREELEELFSNLISNAIKYIRKDSQKIVKLTLTRTDSAAIITITDTGIGIKNENLPNLFKKFYRVKEAETKGISGTGLGLVICKKIIDKHNGTLEVTSTFGEGSTFTISLPVVATS